MRSHDSCAHNPKPEHACRVSETMKIKFSALKTKVWNESHIIWCKVEFIQPSNWLYSVPNLLVFQHLVTLYLGGFDVRVVSEIE